MSVELHCREGITIICFITIKMEDDEDDGEMKTEINTNNCLIVFGNYCII